MSNQTDPKIIAIISYLTIVGWVAGMMMNKEKSSFASFHLRQSLGAQLMWTTGPMIAWVPVAGWVAGPTLMLGGIVFGVIGIVAAIQGREQEVPILGKYFQEWFAGV